MANSKSKDSPEFERQPSEGTIRRCMITGSSGFIGSHVALVLIKEGWSVFGVDKDPAPLFLNKLRPYEYRHIELDITTDIGDIVFTTYLQAYGIELIIHCAGLGNIRQCQRMHTRYHKVNVDGTCNILKIMLKYKIPKIIYISSAIIYSSKYLCSETGQVKEKERSAADEDSPICAQSKYAKTIIEAENAIEEFSKKHNFKAIIFRISNVSGISTFISSTNLTDKIKLSTRFRGLISNTINDLIWGENINLLVGYDTPDRSTYRDYIHIDDVVRAICLGVNQLHQLPIDEEDLLSKFPPTLSNEKLSSATSSQTTTPRDMGNVYSDSSITPRTSENLLLNNIIIYNLGSGESYSSKTIINKCKKIINKRKKRAKVSICLEIQACDWDVSYIWLNCTKIHKYLDWKPTKNIDDIITDIIDHFIF